MRPFTARRLAFAALVPALLVLSVVPGCSGQGEGERCGDDAGVIDNGDCSSGLICVPASTLLTGQTDMTNRCCRPGGVVTDARCQPASGSNSATNSVAGAGGSATSDAGVAGSLSSGVSGGSGVEGGAAGAAGAVSGAGGS
jgi:hypothetical protein